MSSAVVPDGLRQPPPGVLDGASFRRIANRRRPVGWAAIMLLLAPVHRFAFAHPLGNDTITHFSVLYICPNRIEVDFHLDFAEMPADTIRRQEIDANRDGEDTAEEQRAWLNRKATAFIPDLRVSFDGQSLALRPVDEGSPATTAAAEVSPPQRTLLTLTGVGGMPTYRLLIRYAAEFPQLQEGRRYVLDYLDATYPRERGLKRVLLERGAGVTIHERDCQYLDEPPDPFLYELYDPARMPEVRTGRVVFSVSRAAKKTSRSPSWERFIDPRNNPVRADTYRRQAQRIEDLFATGLSMPVLGLIAVLCFGYGAAHALAPGHAKTIVAAYLISLRGTYRHAVMLALIVTLTHTALVMAVGLVFLKVSAPAGSRLQLWLGLTAGVLIACMGGWLMFRALSGRLRRNHAHVEQHEHEHHHDHEHDHDHDHGHDRESDRSRGWSRWVRTLLTHSHPHIHGGPSREEAADSGSPRLTMRLILWLGISGGIVPCPAAIWMMLAGIARGRPAAGLFAVVVFGLGLALTLMMIGFLALSSRRFAERLMGRAGTRRWLLTVLPTVGGAAVTALGLVFVAHYVWRLIVGEPLIAWLG